MAGPSFQDPLFPCQVDGCKALTYHQDRAAHAAWHAQVVKPEDIPAPVTLPDDAICADPVKPCFAKVPADKLAQHHAWHTNQRTLLKQQLPLLNITLF